MKSSIACGILYRRNPLLKRLAALVAVLFMCTGVLWAGDFYFRGTGSWETASEWTDFAGVSLDAVPGADDTVYIVSGAVCSVSSDVTVTGLNVEGTLNVTGATLSVSDGVSAGASSSLVIDNGKLFFTGAEAVTIPSAVFRNSVALYGKDLTFTAVTYDSKPDVTIGNGTKWTDGVVTIPGGTLGTLTLEPDSILFKPAGALILNSFVAAASTKKLDLDGQDLTVNGDYTNNINVTNGGNLTVNGDFTNNNAFASTGTVLVTGDLSNDCLGWQKITGSSGVTVQGSVLSNSGQILSPSGTVSVTGNMETAGIISGESVTVGGTLNQSAGKITGTNSISVTGAASVAGEVFAPTISTGNLTIESAANFHDFYTLNVEGELHNAGIFNFKDNANVTVSKGFYNTASIDTWNVLNLNAEGFDNSGTVKLNGIASTITVSRAFIDSSSTGSLYQNLVLDPGSEIVLNVIAGSATVNSVTTDASATGTTIAVSSGNFGSFEYDSISGGTLSIEGAATFDTLSVTNASDSTLNVTGSPAVENLVLSGVSLEHPLNVTGNGTINASGTGTATGSNISFGDTSPEVTGGTLSVNNSSGIAPDGVTTGGITTLVWLGGTSTVWTVPANWNGGVVPDSGNTQDVLIKYGCSNYPKLTDDVSVGNATITVSSGAILDLNGHTITAGVKFVNKGSVTDSDGEGTIDAVVESAGTFDGGKKIAISSNLSFINSSVKAINSSLEVTGDIDYGTADLTLNGVTIKSTGNQTLKGTIVVSADSTLSSGGQISMGSSSSFSGEGKLIFGGNCTLSIETENITNDVEIAENAVISASSNIVLKAGFSNAGTFISSGTLTIAGDFINTGYVSLSEKLYAGGKFSDSGYSETPKSSYAEVILKNNESVVSGSAEKVDAASVTKFTVLRSNGVSSVKLNGIFNVTDFDIEGIDEDHKISLSGSGIFYVPDSFEKIAANYSAFSGAPKIYKKSSSSDSSEGIFAVATNSTGTMPSGWLNGEVNYIWLGKTSTVWETSSNWVCGRAPAGENAEVFVKASSNNPVISSDVKLKKITLESSARLSVSAGKKLTLYSDTILDGRITAEGSVYITNKENDSSKKISVTFENNQNIKDLYIAGAVDCDVLSDASGIGTLHIQDESNIQTVDFTVSFSGHKLSVTNVDVTRSSTVNNVIGTLEIQNEIEVSNEFKTHSGTEVSIISGGKLTAPLYVHSADQATPESQVTVSGILSADEIRLVGNNNASGSKLTVSESGIVETRKILVLNTYSNGTLTTPVENKGTIKITGTSADDGLEIPDYSGSGSVVLGTAGQIKNNCTSSQNKTLTIASLELKNISDGVFDAGLGNITVTSLKVTDTTEGTSSLEIKGSSGGRTTGIDGFAGKLKNLTLTSGTTRLGAAVTLTGNFSSETGTTVSGAGGVTAGGSFTNKGIYNASGDISCTGEFANSGTFSSGGSVTSTGNLSNTGTWNGNGAVVAENDFTNSGSWTGNGNIKVTENFENKSGKTLSGTGTLEVTGNLTNAGTLSRTGNVSAGGNFTDTGTWNGTGTITFNGTADQNVSFISGYVYPDIVSASENTSVILGTNLSCGNLTVSANSKFDTNGNNLTLENDLSVSGSFWGKSGTHTIGGIVNASGTFEGGSSSVNSTGDITVSGSLAFETGSLTTNGNLEISGTGTFAAGSGTHQVASDATVSGTLEGGSGTIQLGGNWTLENGATYSAETGTVLIQGSGNHTVRGENTFHNFTCATAGASLLFEDGKTQTVNGSLTIKGASGNLLTLDVTSGGSSGNWTLDADPSKFNLEFVNIKNSVSLVNIPGTLDLKKDFNCSDGGNNISWFREKKVYWFGSSAGNKTNWNQTSNWRTSESGDDPVLAAPYYSDSDLEVYIMDNAFSYPVLEADVSVKKLSLNAGTEFDLNGKTLAVKSFENDGIFNLNGGKLSVSGTGSSYANTGKMISQGTETVLVPSGYTTESGTWEYTGGTLKTIGNLSFRNLLVSGAVTLGSNITVSDSFEISEGKSLAFGIYSLTTGSISNSGTLLINGTGRPNINDKTKGLVKYTGSLNIKDFGDVDYFDLEITGTGTLVSNISVANRITLGTGATLNIGNKTLSFDSYSGENEKIKIAGGKIISQAAGTASINEFEVTSSAELDVNASVTSVLCNSSPMLTVSADKEITVPAISAGSLIVNGKLNLLGNSSFGSVLISSTGELKGPENGEVSVGGNWTDQNASGGFIHNSGEVLITENSVISGKSAFYKFYGRNLGGKTIIFADESEISVSNEFYFSGNSGSSRLILSGTGKIKVPDAYVLESGEFVSFAENAPALIGNTSGTSAGIFAVTLGSSAVSSFPAGWVNGDTTYIWLGKNNTDWNDDLNFNWAGNNKSVNGENKEIRIIPEGGNSPILSENVSVKKVSLEKSGASISTGTFSLSLSEYSVSDDEKLEVNGGELIYSGLAGYEISAPVEISSSGKISSTKKLSLTDVAYLSEPDITISGNVSVPGGNIGSLITETGSAVQFESALTVSGETKNQGTLVLKEAGIFASLVNSGILNPETSAEISGDVTNSGTINTGTGNLVFKGKFSGTGGKLIGNLSGNPEIHFEKDVTFGTFVHNNDPVFFEGTGDFEIETNNQNFNEISFTGEGTADVKGKILVAGNLNIEDGKSVTLSEDIRLGGNFTNKGSFTASDGTIFVSGNSEISGNNTFYNFTCQTAGAVIKFKINDTQIISGTMKVTGTENNPIHLDSITEAGKEDEKWFVDVAPEKLEFSYVCISNSKSVQDITSASPSINLKKDYNCVDGGNTVCWFGEYNIYWFGRKDSSWNNRLNWATTEDGSGILGSSPSTNDETLKVVIVKDETDADSDTGAHTLVLSSNITSDTFFIYDGKSVNFAGNSVTANKITNNGNVIVSGTAESVLKKAQDTSEIIHAENSFVVFKDWTSNTAVKTTSSGLGFNSGFENLKIEGSGNFVFANAEPDVVVNGKFISKAAKNRAKGSITLKSDFALTANNEFITGTDSSVIFEGTVDSASDTGYTLKISGDAEFKKDVGKTHKLKSLEVTGETKIYKNEICTTGSQKYSRKITLLSNTSFAGSSVSFGSDVIYSGDVDSGEITIKGNAVINGADPETPVIVTASGVILVGKLSGTPLKIDGDLFIPADAVSSISSELYLTGSFNNEGKCVVSKDSTSTGIITIAGDFKNNNQFSAESGTIILAGSEVLVSGVNSFCNLKIEVPGQKIVFEKGKTQTVTGNLIVKGTSENPVVLCSSVSGSFWYFDFNTRSVNTVVSYAEIQDSEYLGTGGNAAALYSKDCGNNAAWDFPGQSYAWTGNADTAWDNRDNWIPESIPGKGASVEIPENCSVYPVLTSALNLVYDDAIKGSIVNNGRFDLSGNAIKAGSLANNKVLRLTGTESFDDIGTVTAGDESTVIYYGSGASTNLWVKKASVYKKLVLESEAVLLVNSAVKAEVIENSGIINVQNGNVIVQNLLDNAGQINVGSGKTVSFADYKGNDNEVISINAGTLKYTGDKSPVISKLVTTSSGILAGPSASGTQLLITEAEFNSSDLTLSGNISLPSGSAKKVLVSNGQLVLSGDSFELQGLTVKSEGKFVAPSGILTVTGNWENNNENGFDANNGTVIFKGDNITLYEKGAFNKVECELNYLVLSENLTVNEALILSSDISVTNDSYTCSLGEIKSKNDIRDLSFTGTRDVYFNKTISDISGLTVQGKAFIKENLSCRTFEVSDSVEIEGSENREIKASVSQNYGGNISVTGSCIFDSPEIAIMNVTASENLTFKGKVLMKSPETNIEASESVFEEELASNTAAYKNTLNIKGNVEFNKSVDAKELEVSGNAVLKADVKCTENQKFKGIVRIGESIILSGKNVQIDGKVLKNETESNASDLYSLTVQTTSADTAEPAVVIGDDVYGLDNLTVTGILKFNGEKIETSGNQIYNDNVLFEKDLLLSAADKNIDFKKSLNGECDVQVESAQIYFGASSSFRNLKLNSSLKATNKIEITATEDIILNGKSELTDTTLNSRKLSVNENINAGKLNVTVSELFVVAEGKNIVLTGSFTQSGSGKNILSGSFISRNAAVHFNSDVYLKGASELVFGAGDSSDTAKAFTFVGNLIVSMDSPETAVDLNAVTSVNNFVLYRGKVTNVNKITASGDIVLLGRAYTDDDGEPGHQGEFKYTQTRQVSYNYKGFDTETTDYFPDDDKTPLPAFALCGGSLECNSGAVVKAGKNFYANGVSLMGEGIWYLDILENADPKICFAEAYNCDIKNSIVRNSAAGTEKPESSSVVAENCSFDGENRNWDKDDFEIVRAYTVSDNVVYVELSSPVRNKYGELESNIGSIGFNNDGSKESFKKVYSVYSLLDQTGRAGLDVTELKNEENREVTGFYLQTQNDADSRWNTDATGSSTGNSASTDSHGVSQKSVPSIFFERKLKGSAAHFTDRFGKILKVSGTYYTGTEDMASPVLIEVSVGQENHTDYNPEIGPESQPSYDAHNFIEFRYSEPVALDYEKSGTEIKEPPFNEDGDINLFENIRVTDSFGKISSGELFKVEGIASIKKGELIAGSTGDDELPVHALYRKSGMDPHAFRLSIAGYTDTEKNVTDNNGKEYKKWIGYIDSAETPSDKVTLPKNVCPYIKDAAGNTLKLIKWEGVSVSGKSAYSALKDFGSWDVSKPVFAVYRNAGTKWQSPEVSNDYEAVGSTVDGTSSLKRIEFHLFDNKPLYNTTEAQWVSKKGWVRPFTPGPDDDPKLYSADSYAADNVGGSRGFASEGRTKGGIRYCTIADASSAFRYIEVKADSSAKPDLKFSSDIKAYYGAASPIFQPGTNPARSPDKPDGLYFGYKLPSSVLSLKTQFMVSYDAESGFVTDLAGNRLDSAVIKTRDLTPPSFNMTVAPIGQKKIYIMFSKNLNTNTVTLNRQNGTSDNQSALNKALPEAFALGTVSASEGFRESTGNQIDKNVPARVLYANESYMGLELTTTQNITYEDIQNLYIVAKPLEGDYKDPVMDLKTLYATFIQDDSQNYMSAYSAHTLSDFAVNLVQPLYAYNEGLKSGDSNIQNGIFGEDSFAVHDWDAEQKNFGTLIQGGEIHIVSDVNDDGLRSSEDFHVRGYFDNSPDLKAVSEEYNKTAGAKLRVWLPEIPGFKPFTSISNYVNTTFEISDSTKLEDSHNFEFVIPKETADQWKSGGQISFMFGLTDASGNPVTKINSPEYDYGLEKYVMPEPMPLYALRLKNSSDLTSLDLWSFRLKDFLLQKGNVSIFNNVIDSAKGEKTVLHIENPANGRVDVIVMTLDGNVIDYLNRGNLPQGVTELTWDGKNRNGKKVARGMYFIRIVGNGFDETRKVMVIQN